MEGRWPGLEQWQEPRSMGLGWMPQTQVPSVSTTIAPATSKSNYPLSLVLCQMLLNQSSSEQLLLPSSVLVPPCSLPRAGGNFCMVASVLGDGAPPPTRPHCAIL